MTMFAIQGVVIKNLRDYADICTFPSCCEPVCSSSPPVCRDLYGGFTAADRHRYPAVHFHENWGGLNTKTCDAPNRNMTVVCE